MQISWNQETLLMYTQCTEIFILFLDQIGSYQNNFLKNTRHSILHEVNNDGTKYFMV